MSKNMLKKIVFIGFINDYDIIDLAFLKKNYLVVNINLSRFVLLALKKLFCVNCCYQQWITRLLLIKIAKHPDAALYVFKDECYYLPAINSMKNKSILLLRNTVTKNTINAVVNQPFPIYTFDRNDAKQFNFNYYPQYSSALSLLNAQQVGLTSETDFCFVGKNKGRKAYLEAIQQTLSMKYRVKFIVIKEQSKFTDLLATLNVVKRHHLAYLDYLKIQLSCKVVVDLVQENQHSETMRYIEALSAGRKVITNNKNILQHELYHVDNVLYFASCDALKSRIDTFMCAPFHHYAQELLEKYTACHVLSEIILHAIE